MSQPGRGTLLAQLHLQVIRRVLGPIPDGPMPLSPQAVLPGGAPGGHPPELWLGGAEDAVIVLHVRATVTGVHVQCVIEKVQVLLHFRDMLSRVLLRVQDLCGCQAWGKGQLVQPWALKPLPPAMVRTRPE